MNVGEASVDWEGKSGMLALEGRKVVAELVLLVVVLQLGCALSSRVTLSECVSVYVIRYCILSELF